MLRRWRRAHSSLPQRAQRGRKVPKKGQFENFIFLLFILQPISYFFGAGAYFKLFNK
jgi:hypothetical protein